MRKDSHSYFKRFLAILLCVSMLCGSNLSTLQVEAASPFEGFIISRIGGDLMGYVDRAIMFGINQGCKGMDDDAAIAVVCRILFDYHPDHSAEICQEILDSINEVDEDVKESTTYLSGLIASFKSNENMKHLSDMNNSINTLNASTDTAWNRFGSYVSSATAYSSNPTDSNKTTLQSELSLLYGSLENMNFEQNMTAYVNYVSTTKAHYSGAGEATGSRTYLFWLRQFCEDEYVFDHQKIEIIEQGISSNVSVLAKMLQLQNAYIQFLGQELESGNVDQAFYNEKAQEYMHCINIAINAANDIASQYGKELDTMMHQYDLHVQEELAYQSEQTYHEKYTIEYATKGPDTKTAEYHTSAVNTKPVMDFYRVRTSDGKLWLFLKQGVDPAELSDQASKTRIKITLPGLFEEFEDDNPKAIFGHIEGCMESMDWYNLLSTKTGDYHVITDVNQLNRMTSILRYNEIGQDFLYYIKECVGLSAVQGSDTTMNYLFMDSKDRAVYDYGGLIIDYTPEVYLKAKWPDMKKMKMTTTGIDSDCIVKATDFFKKDTESAMVLLESTQEIDTSYKLAAQVQGDGTISITSEEGEVGTEVSAGTRLAITVQPGAFHTLDSLIIQGEEKDYLDPENPSYSKNILNKCLADSADFDCAQKNEDGSMTYYFAMPYQDCTVTASFARDLNTKSYAVSTEISGEGDGTVKLMDSEWTEIKEEDGSNQVQFGDMVQVETKAGIGSRIASIQVMNLAGETLLRLSNLTNTSFGMPSQDCVVAIEFAPSTGDGTDDTSYLIPNYETLMYYRDMMNNEDESVAAAFCSANYSVTQDFSCEESQDITFSAMAALEGYEFNGSFDGRGHTISNLREESSLFAAVGTEGVVRNLTVKDSTSEIAMIATSNEGIIEGCQIQASVMSADSGPVAGIVLSNGQNALIRNCGIDSDSVLEGRNLAGISYWNFGEIGNCYFSGMLKPNNEASNPSEFAASGIMAMCGYNAEEDSSIGFVDHCYCSGTLNTDELGFYPVTQDELATVTGPIVPSKSGTVSKSYYNMLGGFVTQRSVTNENYQLAQMYESDMNNDEFRDTLNAYWNEGNQPEGYLIWNRCDEVNSGFPTFDTVQDYYVTQEVSGSGSIAISRENGKDIIQGISEGENIIVEISALEGAKLYSIGIYGEEDPFTCYGEFSDITESSISFTMPAEDVVVKADFSNLSMQHKIKSTVEGVGEIHITNEHGATITSSVFGESIYLQAVPGDEYSLESFELLDSSGEVLQSFNGSESTFVMGEDDCEVHARFVKGTPFYKLTSSVLGEGNGNIVMTKSDGSDAGDEVTGNEILDVKLTPEAGAYPASAYVKDSYGNVMVSLLESYKIYLKDHEEDGTYLTSFSMPTCDSVVEVTYQMVPDIYSLSSNVEGEGNVMISASDGMLYQGKTLEGTTLDILAVPDAEGIYPSSIKAFDEQGNELEELPQDPDYSAEGLEKKVTYTMPAQNVELRTVFEEEPKLPQEDDVYLISSYEDLVKMAWLVKNVPETYAEAKYRQTNNISCENNEWRLPIGTESTPFEGDYEGYDFYVLGLRISDGSTGGLFGVIGEKGKVSNLSVVDMDYSTASAVAGGLAAVNKGTIEGCGSGVNITSAVIIYPAGVPAYTLNSDVKGNIAGGLVGQNHGTIQNSRSTATLDGTTVGGIAGENDGNIQNVYNVGVVYGTETAGGVVGKNQGIISMGYNGKIVTGAVVGGIAGTSENLELGDLWYPNTMTAACGNHEDSELTVTPKSIEDMKTIAFCDILNEAVTEKTKTKAKEADVRSWVWSSSKNEKYPRIEQAIVQQQTITNSEYGISVTGAIHPGAQLELVHVESSEKEYQAIDHAVNEGKIKDCWRLKLVYEDGTYSTWEGNLKISFSQKALSLAANDRFVQLQEDETFYEKLPENKGGTLSVTTDTLGVFALVATDSSGSGNPTLNKSETQPTKTAGSGSDVNTGDNTGAVIVVLAVLAVLSGITIVVVLARKKEEKKQRKDGEKTE